MVKRCKKVGDETYIGPGNAAVQYWGNGKKVDGVSFHAKIVRQINETSLCD